MTTSHYICLWLVLSSQTLVGDHQVWYQKIEDGTLAGDVQNWAMLIQNYILQLASEGIKREYTQSLFDTANYTFEEKDGDVLVRQVKESLGNYFRSKRIAARRIADRAVDAYDRMLLANMTVPPRLTKVNLEMYRDTDIPSRLPTDLGFSPYFKQTVSLTSSAVKIPDEVPRDDPATINTVVWTSQINDVFKLNAVEDEQIRWQYFGSNVGLTRMYPGREWDTNFAGFYNDYDPRVRPWYIAATGGPKDVIIILDCSLSMRGEKFTIAQGVAKTVINTLTKQDYVNVVCARASHWDEVGKWHYFSTKVLSCQQERLVPATVAHRKDLIEKTFKLVPGGTSELERGIEVAFDLLNGKAKTGCQSVIVFVTDGKDTDGEEVRCGPGLSHVSPGPSS
ncbi:hypothetical protein NP493_1112g00000 [Ridgeia piscesae]|uniref:VWFA domain-containing protein n=1 Tax=Ridgeia piscesae TaxID=27915 RepID=A0AAD9KG51_RIDPI|nr:hypothetical protein NP493_1112g00000 [Ridgeia piscesae]